MDNVYQHDGRIGYILVVEDEEPVRELLRLYLEKEGFQVAMALDGQEALFKVAQRQPDLILLDIMLPKLDGWCWAWPCLTC